MFLTFEIKLSLTCKLLKFLPVSWYNMYVIKLCWNYVSIKLQLILFLLIKTIMETGFGILFYATARSYYVMTLSSPSVYIISPKSESLWKRFVLKDPPYKNVQEINCLCYSIPVYCWSIVYEFMKRKFKQWWSTIPPILIYYHLSPLLTEHKKTTTYKVGNPVLDWDRQTNLAGLVCHIEMLFFHQAFFHSNRHLQRHSS